MPSNPSPFAGFSEETLQFLVDLEQNNRREWFNTRKAFFKETVEEELRRLVWSTSAALAKKRIPLSTDPKKAIFRIYRDTRFSADKSPYKTNLGAVFRTSDKKEAGVLYVHIEPNASFTALGFYQPVPLDLTRIREAIADHWAEFRKVVKHLEAGGLEFRETESLKRLPRGFEQFADTESAKYLKYKSFIVSRTLNKSELRSADLPATLVDFTIQGLPLLRFGWEAIGRKS